MLCSDIELISALKLKADKQMKMFNGALECAFNLYTLHAQSTRRDTPVLPEGVDIADIAPAFANRIKKNAKQLEKWAKKKVSTVTVYMMPTFPNITSRSTAI